MGLAEGRIDAVIAVSDMDKAKEFYEGTLGLSGGEAGSDGGVTYTLGGGTKVHVYPSPDNAGSSTATVAAFVVSDVEGTVDELTGKGISFEQYGDPINTDDKGIARLDDESIAWFKDPDGNTLGVGSA
jgi:catechol 2,3-dioxygenase-like lactoylglutathione lyase family enzyme